MSIRNLAFFAFVATLLVSASAYPRCLGCPKVINPESEEVYKALSFIVQELELKPDAIRKFAAAVQVVNGLNYYLTFEIEKGNRLDVFQALVYRNSSAVFFLTSFEVLISRRSGSCAGCVKDVDVHALHVLKAAEFAWSELEKEDADVDAKLGHNFKVHAAGVQVVNGLNYFLLLEAEFDNIRVVYTASIYKNLNTQQYLTRARFDKHLIPGYRNE